MNKEDPLCSLVLIAEGKVHLEILFSIPLPTEIVAKYEIMREKSFEKAGIDPGPSKIWKLQRHAHARQKEKDEDLKNKELKSSLDNYEQYLLEIIHKTETILKLPYSHLKQPLNFESLTDTLNSKIQNLCEWIDSISKEKNHYQQMLANLEEEVKKLQIEDQDFLSENLKLKEENFKLCSQLDSETKKLRSETEWLSKSLESEVQRLRSENNNLSLHYETEIHKLNAESSKLSAEVQTLQLSLEKRDMELETVKSESQEIAELSAQYRILEEELLSKLSAANLEISSLKENSADVFIGDLNHLISPIYAKYADDSPDLYTKIGYLLGILDKIVKDNHWLINALSDRKPRALLNNII